LHELDDLDHRPLERLGLRNHLVVRGVLALRLPEVGLIVPGGTAAQLPEPGFRVGHSRSPPPPNKQLTCPAATPATTTTSREASGNNSRGRVRCSVRFGLPSQSELLPMNTNPPDGPAMTNAKSQNTG